MLILHLPNVEFFLQGLSYAYPASSITESLELLVQEMKAQVSRREIQVVQYTQQGKYLLYSTHIKVK